MFERLIYMGANVLKTKKDDGFSILHICAANGDPRLLAIALKNIEKRHVDMPSEKGFTASHVACFA